MSKFTRIFIKIIVLLIYVIFIMDFLTPPYNYEIGGMTFLNVPIAIYLEILGYLNVILGIALGIIICLRINKWIERK